MWQKISLFLRKNKWWVLGLLGGVAFFVCYVWFAVVIDASRHFPSPDEASNAFWSEVFRQDSVLWQVNPLSVVYGDVVHPRSMRAIEGMLVPGGFLGLPVLIGLVGKIWGVLMIGVVPLFAVFGVVSFGMIVGAWVGNRRVGVIAGVLAGVHPAWWYWASRVYMPQVAAMSLAMMSVLFVVCQPMRKKMLNVVLSAVCAGLALVVRPDVVVWFVLAAMVGMVWYRKAFFEVCWKRDLMVWIGVFVVVLVPFLVMNYATYGVVFGSGYGSGLEVGVVANAEAGWFEKLVFPLGFAPRLAWQNGVDFLLYLFPLWSGLVAMGVVYWAWLVFRKKGVVERVKEMLRGQCVYDAFVTWLIVMIGVGGYMVLFYGSYVLSDNTVVGAVTIGISYTRYWLLLYLLSVIPVAVMLGNMFEEGLLWHKPRNDRIRIGVVIGVMVGLVISGWKAVWWAPHWMEPSIEKLSQVENAVRGDAKLAEEILVLTETGSVIVTERADKFLFPARQVIVPLRSLGTFTAVEQMLGDGVPVYYFGFSIQDDEEVRLGDFVLKRVKVFGVLTLYKVTSN
jgi:hypothetical protein